jgi:hypothetical protein
MVLLSAMDDGASCHVSNGNSLDGSHEGTESNGASVNGKHVTEAGSQVPIAICGMSIRLPGGLHSPQELWDFLISKGDARGPVAKSKYNGPRTLF